MATRVAVFPEGRQDLYTRNRYSAAVRAGGLLFVSGQVGSREDGSPEPDLDQQVRRAFANPHVVSALLVDGDAFAGLVNRVDLPEAARDDAPARDFADAGVVTVRPSTALTEAVKTLDADQGRRLVVLEDDGRTLAGLLCLDESRSSFCQ